MKEIMIFLTATWLPSSQLWSTVEGAAKSLEGHQEPCSPVNSPFTIEFTKAISQLSNANRKYFFSFFVLVNALFIFLFFRYFYGYFLAIIKSWPLALNLFV